MNKYAVSLTARFLHCYTQETLANVPQDGRGFDENGRGQSFLCALTSNAPPHLPISLMTIYYKVGGSITHKITYLVLRRGGIWLNMPKNSLGSE